MPERKLPPCPFCKTDNVWVRQHSGLWKVFCSEHYCLIVQCCKTKQEAIERYQLIVDSVNNTQRYKEALEEFRSNISISPVLREIAKNALKDN